MAKTKGGAGHQSVRNRGLPTATGASLGTDPSHASLEMDAAALANNAICIIVVSLETLL